ncbi:hypothetical protein D3C74_411530 [compost metagenome]
MVIRLDQMVCHDFDSQPCGRFWWKGNGFGADQFQFSQLGFLPGKQVQHDLGAEPGRADSQPGEPGAVGDFAAMGEVEKGEEARAGVDGPAPGVGELHAG